MAPILSSKTAVLEVTGHRHPTPSHPLIATEESLDTHVELETESDAPSNDISDSGHTFLQSHVGTQENRKRGFLDRIGYTAVTTLIVGLLLLLGALSILLFIWIGAARALRSEDPGSAWQTIVFSGWTTRVVTLRAAAIRAVITAQAYITTSMIASLYLESAGSILHHLPLLSITRAVDISPSSLIPPALTSLEHLPGAYYSSLAVTTALLVVVSQFTSTILLSDFEDTNVATPKASKILNTISEDDAFEGGTDFEIEEVYYGINFFWFSAIDFLVLCRILRASWKRPFIYRH
ncbi:hypothetical protein F4819DRAFT_492856 [Hypoxylon fuscum]|nr:hypothetical protein F4819DRAFT_492856 [Hypoxylon fuscum]